MKTVDELRSHYSLRNSPNPAHYFSFWKYLGSWQIASDKVWAKIDSSGKLNEYYFAFTKITDEDGVVLRTLIIGRLNITIGRTDQ